MTSNSSLLKLLIVLIFQFIFVGCSTTSKQSATNISAFTPIPAQFTHKWDKKTHPFTGAAVIDSNNDGKYEVFVGGGQNQTDILLSYSNGKLINIEPGTGLSNLSATHGATAIDIDDDADTDLIVARDNGVYLYLNQDGRFQEKRLDVDLPKNSVPFNIAISDIDHDGDGDLYISTFVGFPSFRSSVYNDPIHAKANRLLLNNGDLTFTDITAESGTAGKSNTFLSVFVDLNGDEWQDLVLAQNTGEVEIFQNMKNSTFKPISYKTQLGAWMGLAIGDIDHDGDQDLFFTNIGKSIPKFITKGDLKKDQTHTHEWLLLTNEGNFNFTDQTQAYNLTGEGFSWGAVFEDLNLDGKLDLLVAQNYLKWPVHKLFKLPGRTFIQTEINNKNIFVHAKSLRLANKHFGQSPLIVDFDGDGRQDVMWINMSGPVRAFRNTSTANFVTVKIPDNVASLGTRITLKTSKGNSYTRDVLAGVGLLTDQTPDLSFGLGNQKIINSITVQHPNGSVEVIKSPLINTQITIK